MASNRPPPRPQATSRAAVKPTSAASHPYARYENRAPRRLRTAHRGGRIGWEHRRRNSWVPAGVVLDIRQRIREATNGLSDDVLVTGTTALFLYGIATHPGESVELLAPNNQHLRPQDGVCAHRTRVFDDVRYLNKDGLRLAVVQRSLADAAVHSSVNTACRDIAAALRTRQCALPLVAAELNSRKRYPGRATLRKAYALLRGEVTHSSDERLGRRLLLAEGMTPHPRPLAVEHSGRLVAEIDIPFVDAMYGVEIDGPHHLLPEVAAADRIRDRQLNDIGWTIDRFFWFELEERPQWFVREVQRRLGRGLVIGEVPMRGAKGA